MQRILSEKRRRIDREVKFGIVRERTNNVKKIGSRAAAKGDLPGVAERGFFVKSRGGKANKQVFIRRIFELCVVFFGTFDR